MHRCLCGARGKLSDQRTCAKTLDTSLRPPLCLCYTGETTQASRCAQVTHSRTSAPSQSLGEHRSEINWNMDHVEVCVPLATLSEEDAHSSSPRGHRGRLCARFRKSHRRTASYKGHRPRAFGPQPQGRHHAKKVADKPRPTSNETHQPTRGTTRGTRFTDRAPSAHCRGAGTTPRR